MTQALEYLERLISEPGSKVCTTLERTDFANVYLHTYYYSFLARI